MGLVVGFALSSGLAPENDHRGSTPERGGTAPPEPSSPLRPTAPSPEEARPAAPGGPEAASSRREAKVILAEIDTLKSRVKQLEAELELDQGKRVAWPLNVDPKFTEKNVLQNFNRAIQEAGIASEIALVDCDEFPCIACGYMPKQSGENVDINKDIEALQRVAKAKALEVYKGAKKTGSVDTQRNENDAGEIAHQSVFCQSFFPGGEDESADAALKARINFRMRSLRGGMH